VSDGRFLTAYLDLPFLKKLLRSKPDRAAPPDDEWPEAWQNVYRFLQRSARIVVDASLEDIKSERILTRFFLDSGQSSHVDPRPGVSEQYSDPDAANIDDPYSVFLFDNPEIPVDDLRQQKGLLFLRHDDLDEHWLRLFSEHVIDIQPEASNSFSWEQLLPHSEPLNAILIADKYAFAPFKESEFEENIGALLCAVLPKGPLDRRFHVTIVADLELAFAGKRNGPPPKEPWYPGDICDFVRSFIKDCRPNLEFYLTLIGHKPRGGHKDRFLFTNYGLFTSNDSFAFFKDGELNKETLVQYLPNSIHGKSVTVHRLQRFAELCSSPRKAYAPRRSEAVQLAEGDFRNRLLDELT
jgi:hypothetical protein